MCILFERLDFLERCSLSTEIIWKVLEESYSESYSYNIENVSIFSVNFIELFSRRIHGASGFLSTFKTLNLESNSVLKAGNISGGYTFGKGMQSLTYVLEFYEFLLLMLSLILGI